MLSVVGSLFGDIDLSYTAESKARDARKKKLKNTIVNVMDTYGFSPQILMQREAEEITNCYRADYPSMYEKSNVLKPELVVETYVALFAFSYHKTHS